ncbi:MAG: alcohol dehydrogenase [Planctomycetes bacterium]|nr:alcohol dehydrogenase [Planctomycetota bacterium]
MNCDIAFEMATSSVRFGTGVTREVGMDLADMGARRIMVVTDSTLGGLQPVATVIEALQAERLEFVLFDRVHIEPTDASFKDAIAFAQAGSFDAFVAVGGGSVIDTAKAANLYSSHPADFLSYVNPPIGKGEPIPGQLKPLIAIPTTAGTGSETTGVAIFDLLEMRAKTGIADRRLKPTLGLIDPDNTKTLPPMVVAATGLDVFCHALESYTALPFDQRVAPRRPLLRPAYQGCNPISDVWSAQALRLGARYLVRAFDDPQDEEARSSMLLAATYAGVGFGNAGVHLPHGMSYPVSGMVRDYRPPGYDVDKPTVPHGISVVLNAPAVFRYTGSACPERHLQAAELIGADVAGAAPADAGQILADRVTWFMERLGIPNGLRAVGYSREDIPALVKGTLPQHRVTKLSPRPALEEDLSALFEEALVAW